MSVLFKVFLFLFLKQGFISENQDTSTRSGAIGNLVIPGVTTLQVCGQKQHIDRIINVCQQHNSLNVRVEFESESGESRVEIQFTEFSSNQKNVLMKLLLEEMKYQGVINWLYINPVSL